MAGQPKGPSVTEHGGYTSVGGGPAHDTISMESATPAGAQRMDWNDGAGLVSFDDEKDKGNAPAIDRDKLARARPTTDADAGGLPKMVRYAILAGVAILVLCAVVAGIMLRTGSAPEPVPAEVASPDAAAAPAPPSQEEIGGVKVERGLRGKQPAQATPPPEAGPAKRANDPADMAPGEGP